MADNHFWGCGSDSFKDCWCESIRYFLGLGVVTATFVVQSLGAWWFHSLALLADAVHLMTDILMYAIAIYVARAVRKSTGNGSSIRRSGMIWTVLLLILALGYMLAEVPGRLQHPPQVDAIGMMSIAAVAAIGNMLQHAIISQGEDHDTTHGLTIHILTDLAASFGIIIAGLIIFVTGLQWMDAVATLLVIFWAVWRSFGLLKGDGHHGHSH